MSSAPSREAVGAQQLLTWYEDQSWKFVLVSRRTKKAIEDEWQNRETPLDRAVDWVSRGGNIGIQAGEASNWICGVDQDCPEAVQLAPAFLWETLKIRKGGQAPSVHVFRAPGLGFKKYKDLDGSTLIDVKASNNGAGHMFIVAPSIHPNKGPYEWVEGFNPAAVVEVSQERLRKAVDMLAVATLIARHLPDKGRHDFAMALAGYLLRNGASVEDTLRILLEAWKIKYAPREALRDIEGIVRDTKARLDQNQPTTGGRTLEETMPGMPARIAKFLGWERADGREQRCHYMRTDLGNAERFVDQHSDRVRWCPARKSFLYWDGKRWTWDEKGEVNKLAHQTARSIFNEAARTEDADEQKKIAGFAAISQNTTRIKAMLTEAKPYLAVGMDELDTDPWVLNCQNGTLDLRIGVLKPHNPADLITKIVPVDYAPDADCPRFKKFLKEVLIDQAVISFVKRYSGYSATGITRERLFAILYGFGKNGKTTLVELIQDVLGDYATNTDTETILTKRYQGVSNDVAALKGTRCVSAAEVEKGRRLAESKIKQLTGSDTVTARFMFGEFFSFRPRFKLWLSTNNKPVVQGTDDAIWDRIRLIPFTQRFEGNNADPKLPEKLREELPGILAWIVEGCLEWQEHGLGEPDSVLNATKQYRTEMDTLATFIDERCVLGPACWALAERIYQHYSIWCDKSGEPKEPQKGFVARLSERGFERKRATRGVNRGRYVWLGIGLRDDEDPTDPTDEGSQSEPKSEQASHQESRSAKPKTGEDKTGSEPSEAKNNNPHSYMPREEEDVNSGFTGFTRFTKSEEEYEERFS